MLDIPKVDNSVEEKSGQKKHPRCSTISNNDVIKNDQTFASFLNLPNVKGTVSLMNFVWVWVYAYQG